MSEKPIIERLFVRPEGGGNDLHRRRLVGPAAQAGMNQCLVSLSNESAPTAA
jgi:hypothetical protein